MKGLVKYAKGETGVELRELPVPEISEGQLLVKVLAAGICGSDLHALKDEGSRAIDKPTILGHEFVGQVEKTCGDTGDLKKGDWVVTLPACYGCGDCYYCKRGLVTLCPQRKSIGTHRNGAMANYVAVPAKYSFKLPASADTLAKKKQYALMEPMCCNVRGIYERISVKPGDVVVVSGPGPMGVMAVQLFKSRGAYVICSGLPQDAERLAIAKKNGADEIVTSFEALQEAVYRNNSYGADITCDISGAAPSIRNCVEVIRPNGTHLQIGLFGKAIEVNLDRFFDKEAAFIPTNSTATSSWKIGMTLFEQGKINFDDLISAEVPLENWREGFDIVMQKDKMKVILIPDNEFEED